MLATGSIYLIADLVRASTRTREPPYYEPRMNDDGPSFLTMIGFVAVVVATVVLLFFGIGFLLGRLFVS